MHTEETKKKMSESAKKRGMPEEVRLKGIKAKAESEKGGRTEKNRNAKKWHLISPDGKEYIVSNLTLFARNNPELFNIDGSDKECIRVMTRFSVLKWQLKNAKKQTTCLGGWKIIIQEDDRINKYRNEE